MSHEPLKNTLSDRMRVIAGIRAVLSKPPTAQLQAIVSRARSTEKDPAMVKFLDLISDDNVANRAKAQRYLLALQTSLESKDHAAGLAAAMATLDEPGHVEMEEPVDLVGALNAMDTEVPGPLIADMSADALAQIVPPPGSKLAAAMNTVGKARHALTSSVQPDVYRRGPVLDMPLVNHVPAMIPFYIENDQLEWIPLDREITQAQLDAGQKPNMQPYTLITQETPYDLLQGQSGWNIEALVLGIAGQQSVQHGFGLILTLPQGQIKPLDLDGVERCIVNMNLNFPGPVIVYDHHEAATNSGLSRFMALYDVLSKGYGFQIDMEIIPTGSALAFATNPDKKVFRVLDKQTVPVQTSDLADLAYAGEKLVLLGFLAKVEG